MKNTGRELEQLVSEIERLLTPKGIDVESRVRKYGEDGKQIAEFDILIKGQLGSSTINWLIECRDRPSEGPAPSSWIEQLYGRRERFNFDKIIAVSTTGFVEDAKNFARQKNILTRTVTSIEDLASDFEFINNTWKLVRVDLLDSNLDVKLVDKKDRKYLKKENFFSIKLSHENEFYHLKDFITNILRQTPTIVAATNDFSHRYKFKYTGEAVLLIDKKHIVKISELIKTIILTVTFYKSDILFVKKYSEEDRVIGKLGSFCFEMPDGKVQYRILLVPRDDGKYTVQFYYPDEIPPNYGRIKIGNQILIPTKSKNGKN